MKKTIIGMLTCILFSFALAHAQDAVDYQVTTDYSTGTNPAASKAVVSENPWYYGGTIGLNLWNDYTYFGAYPMIGYKATPQLSVGGKLGYAYISDDRYDPLPSIDTSNYGGSIFSRYRVIPQLYVHGEFAYWSYENVRSYNVDRRTYETQRDWVPYLLLGGGLSQKLGGNTWAFVEVLFDVLQDDNSPYDDWEPFFSFGVGVGF